MSENVLFYRRHLPHFQPPGATLFVTFRLYGSLPRHVLLALKEESKSIDRKAIKLALEERKAWLEQEHKRMFARWDSALDQADTGPTWLREERIANMVAESLHYLDGKKYELLVYSIMPNHVHVVFTPLSTDEEERSYFTLANIMQSLKGYTAREINKVLGRQGPFWQDESYDHVVRDNEELKRIAHYVLNNPVKAGLAGSSDEWPWNYRAKSL